MKVSTASFVPANEITNRDFLAHLLLHVEYLPASGHHRCSANHEDIPAGAFGAVGSTVGFTTFWRARLTLALVSGWDWDSELALRFTMSLGEILN